MTQPLTTPDGPCLTTWAVLQGRGEGFQQNLTAVSCFSHTLVPAPTPQILSSRIWVNKVWTNMDKYGQILTNMENYKKMWTNIDEYIKTLSGVHTDSLVQTEKTSVLIVNVGETKSVIQP